MVDDAHPELTPVEGGVVLSVHAQPGARRTEVVGRHGEAVKIRVAAPAVEGRANEALIAFVADEFGLRKSAVTVRSGGSSRHKRLRLDGIDPTAAAQVVDRLVRPS
jgi:uncharacterized protein (TIGR00251 family)